ncbi:MAG: hypothetical protein IJP48_07170 [Synergistaceae bacterium]|nr:hypothetical protein [Synergistaceae bacterium]
MGDISLKGYHGTCSFSKESIEQRGLDPDATKPRSNHWLGKGVYFFIDKIQAQWWAEDISSKNHGSFPVIYSATIVAEAKYVLNLDNNDELAAFYQFIKENIETINVLCRAENKGSPVFDKQQFRSVFFDYYKREFGIKVIIHTFQKDFVKYVPNHPVNKADRKRQRELFQALALGFKESRFVYQTKSASQIAKWFMRERRLK